MPRWRRWTTDRRRGGRLADDDGSASLEFLVGGLVLLVPLVYLVVALASLQGASLAAEGAARQAARVYIDQRTDADARVAADRAASFALADYGFGPQQAEITIGCRPAPGECLRRRSVVTVTVRLRAPLPLVPDVLDARDATSIPILAQATQVVPRFGGRP